MASRQNRTGAAGASGKKKRQPATGGSRSRNSRGSNVRSTSRSPKRRGKLVRQASAFSMPTNIDRLTILQWVFVAVTVLIIGRLFMVQIMQHDVWVALAQDQHALERQLLPERGEIYVHDKYSETGLSVIATNQQLQQVYVNPKQAQDNGQDLEKIAETIAPILREDEEEILARLEKEGDLYEPVKNSVPEQEIEALEAAIEEEELMGVHWLPEDARYYPEGEITSSITGFVGIVDDERAGQYGLEGYYNEELSGQKGHLSTELDAFGRFIAVGDKTMVEAQDGDTLILSIDANIQYKACTLLADAVEKHGADQGTVLVMNPKTGGIMALCNAPLYDPNNYSNVEDIGVFLNDAISDQYEPGSVMKPITMAAGLNEGVVTPYTTYEDTGEIKVGRFTISNSDFETRGAHGVVDMVTVLQESLNTGSIYVATEVGDRKWYEYLQAFGFGERTGIEISGENPGNIASVKNYQDVYTATSSYGHGMTVTPLQMIQSYAAIANGGKMMKPYIVEQVVKSNGYTEEVQPEVVATPIAPETATTLGAMLVRVIDEGHATHAQVDGYYMGGKTGTALVPKENGGYDTFRHKDTFVGFGPVSDPEFVVLVKIDEPKDVRYAAASVAPVFGDLAAYMVNYLQIPPDRE